MILNEQFKKQLNEEIAYHRENSPKNRELIRRLNDIEKLDSLEAVIAYLKAIKHPDSIKLVAGSAAIFLLIAQDPDAFIQIYSRDNMKAIIHQAAKTGNAPLVDSLIEKIQLNLPEEKVPSAFASYSCNKDGTYSFHDAVPLLHLAAKSGSLPLIQAVILFYDLAKQPNPELEVAMMIAARHGYMDVVRYLLDCGVNVNATAGPFELENTLINAITFGSLELTQLLIERGAEISYRHLERAVSCGRLEIVQYFESRDKAYSGVTYNYWRHDLLDAAIRSCSAKMLRYLHSTLGFNLYSESNPTPQDKEDCDNRYSLTALSSGSIDMVELLEDLGIPVTELLKKELATVKSYRDYLKDNMHESLLKALICTYKIALIKFMFETKGAMPDKNQLADLEGYAYDNGASRPQHNKLVTHAYVYSFLHENEEMRRILLAVSCSSDLHDFSLRALFLLYADYVQNFPAPSWAGAEDNTGHLNNEIARRYITQQDLLDLIRSGDAQVSTAVLFFLVTNGFGLTDEEANALLKEEVLDANFVFKAGNTPLHYALTSKRFQLAPVLVEKGADVDAINDARKVPVLLLDFYDKKLALFLSASKSVHNSLTYSMQMENWHHLVSLLKHTKGNLGSIEVMPWLESGKSHPKNIYHALCHIDESAYTHAKERISASSDYTLKRALKWAEYYRVNGEEKPEIKQAREREFKRHLEDLYRGGGRSRTLCIFAPTGRSMTKDESSQAVEMVSSTCM